MTKKKLISAALMLLPMQLAVAEPTWYAGVTGGVSSLRPITTDSGFNVDSSVSYGGGALLGYDINDRFSAEVAYSYLGAANLSNKNRKTKISYSAFSVGGLYYWYGDANDIAERDGFSSFVRLGFNFMQNSTQGNVPLTKSDNTAIWAGVGLEFPMSDNFNLRGEVTTFDGDAQALRVSAVFRPTRYGPSVRASSPVAKTPRVEAPQVEASKATAPKVEAPKVEVPKVEVPKVVAPTVEAPRGDVELIDDTVRPSVDVPATRAPRFSGPLIGVEFAKGSATLTPASTPALQQLVTQLQANPNVVIEIQSHTESFGNAATANTISKQRTIAVARFLASRGIAVSRLRARAFGHSQPVASDNTAAGQQQNNRIELRVVR